MAASLTAASDDKNSKRYLKNYHKVSCEGVKTLGQLLEYVLCKDKGYGGGGGG
jgi:hypothetical protein